MTNLARVDGRLALDGHPLDALAARFGTPLHVVSAATLRARCLEFTAAFQGWAPGVRVHFSYKTNPVAGVLRLLHGAGLGAEVVSGYELWLARRLGVAGRDLVFNGPNKSDDELAAALEAEVGLVVVDGLGELARLERIASERGRIAPVALRICPEVVARGMNTSSASGSRRSQFGLDLGSGTAGEAIRRCLASPRLRLRGAHAHIGSGIHDLAAFGRAARRAVAVQAEMARGGAEPDLLDLGGGLGAHGSRELTTAELLLYLATGRLPAPASAQPQDLFARYGAAIQEAVASACRAKGIPRPTLVLEPGRALVSDAQVLLLSVGDVRSRPGLGRYALVDGGAMTVSLMFLSELHTVLLANRDAPVDGRTSVFGRLPSPLDVVYRGLRLPALQRGDVLAVLDAGAYFTSTATRFGGPAPAVAICDETGVRLTRRRERFEDLAAAELALSPEAT